MKQVFAPALGKRVKMGRIIPKTPPICLRFCTYALKALPTPPPSCDYSQGGMKSLKNIYHNDELGICVCAGHAHVRGVTSGNADGCVTFTDQQIIGMYSAIGGYVPGDPSTDRGCDIQTANEYLTNTGFPDGVKLAGWLAVDPTNAEEVQLAIWLFENIVIGEALPDAYVGGMMPNGDGFTWGVAGSPDYNNGHEFMAYGYDSAGVKIDTWACLGTHTWEALAKYASSHAGGECYTLLSPDMIAKATQKAPNGLNWTQLISDFDSMGGHVPMPPSPIPPVPPVPAPVPPNVKQMIDDIFAKLEKQFAFNPTIVLILKIAQKYVDQYLDQHAMNVSVSAYPTISWNPIALIPVIDSAFKAAEQAYPEYAAVLAVLNSLFDKWLQSVG